VTVQLLYSDTNARGGAAIGELGGCRTNQTLEASVLISAVDMKTGLL
jgi:hypothetical protein